MHRVSSGLSVLLRATTGSRDCSVRKKHAKRSSWHRRPPEPGCWGIRQRWGKTPHYRQRLSPGNTRCGEVSCRVTSKKVRASRRAPERGGSVRASKRLFRESPYFPSPCSSVGKSETTYRGARENNNMLRAAERLGCGRSPLWSFPGSRLQDMIGQSA
jgi:hypothetical protein